MKQKILKMIFRLSVVAIMSISYLPIIANDGAAEVALGGIILKKEARISMEKERLTIALNKVTVEYEFLNDTDKDITTLVAFPIPDCSLWVGDGYKRINDFKLWINNIPTQYHTENRAILNEIDYTKLLVQMGIPADSFEDNQLFNKLPADNKKLLIEKGLLKSDKDDVYAAWLLRRTYYWEQKFPAGQIVSIRHEYTPAIGLTTMGLESTIKEDQDIFKSGCLPQNIVKKLDSRPKNVISNFRSAWVKYILKTANTWKTPIKDFELLVEISPQPEVFASKQIPQFASFCWNGTVEKLGGNRLRARVKNFVPKTDLTVYYFFY